MALKIEYLAIDQIREYERNAREHSQVQVDQIVASIEEFGFTNPVLIDKSNVLIAGHGRLAAADQMGLEEVPAIRLGDLTEKQAKALRIADNQLALNASWDLDLLSSELSELDDQEFDLELLGFDEDFLRGLLPDDPESDFSDGQGEGESSAGDDQSEVVLIIGPYKLKVDRRKWDAWETQVRAKVGFDPDDVAREIERRLGL
jgi:ParB family chromosome partitioning protein